MALSNQPYDPVKIEKLKHLLGELSGKGHPRPYEIYVDNLKVVPKTEDPEQFDGFEFYMDEHTQRIRILIYNSAASPRNDQYCFVVKKAPAFAGLDGIDGPESLDGIIQKRIQEHDRNQELGRLQQELSDTKTKLGEAEAYAEMLEGRLEEANSNKYKLGKLDLVELGGLLLENYASKNAGLLGKIGVPGLGELPAAPAMQEPEPEVSFRRKGAKQQPDIDPELLKYLPFLKQMDEAFTQEQLQQIVGVINKMAEDPSQIPVIAQLLNVEQNRS